MSQIQVTSWNEHDEVHLMMSYESATIHFTYGSPEDAWILLINLQNSLMTATEIIEGTSSEDQKVEG
jgi:hypothetical protein